MNKLILITIFALMILPMVNAEYLGHKQNTPFDLVVQSNNATQCNLSYIQYPGGTNTIYNIVLTKSAHTFYQTLNSNNFSALGNLCMGLACTDGNTIETGSVCREVTYNGKTNISGGVIVLFSLLFLVVLVGGITIVIYGLGHFVKLDMDILDVGYHFGIFFAFIGLLYLEDFYLGNPMIGQFFNLILK